MNKLREFEGDSALIGIYDIRYWIQILLDLVGKSADNKYHFMDMKSRDQVVLICICYGNSEWAECVPADKRSLYDHDKANDEYQDRMVHVQTVTIG